MNVEPLTVASIEQRFAAERAEDTLRKRHNEMVAALTNLPVPLRPDTYMRHLSLAICLQDDAHYLRQVVEAIAQVFEKVADDAADYGGARIESFDLVRGAATDFISALEVAAEEMGRRR